MNPSPVTPPRAPGAAHPRGGLPERPGDGLHPRRQPGQGRRHGSMGRGDHWVTGRLRWHARAPQARLSSLTSAQACTLLAQVCADAHDPGDVPAAVMGVLGFVVGSPDEHGGIN